MSKCSGYFKMSNFKILAFSWKEQELEWVNYEGLVTQIFPFEGALILLIKLLPLTVAMEFVCFLLPLELLSI